MTANWTYAELRKGLQPAPVYEAHFVDGTISRSSFWSHKDKPLDVDQGKRINLKFSKNRGKVFSHGFVEYQGRRANAEHPELVYQPKAKAKTGRVNASSYVAMREALQTIIENKGQNAVAIARGALVKAA